MPQNKKNLQLMIFLAFTKLETVTSFQLKDKVEPTSLEQKQYLFNRVENLFITLRMVQLLRSIIPKDYRNVLFAKASANFPINIRAIM